MARLSVRGLKEPRLCRPTCKRWSQPVGEYESGMADYPDLDSTHELVPNCERCPALVDSRERISWGNGPLDAEIVVVGEAPGAGTPEADRWKGGDWTGMAYTARHSGGRIRDLMAGLGYEDEAYFTSAVKCFPSDGEGSN